MNTPQLLYCRFCAEEKPVEAISDLRLLLEMRNEITYKLSYFTKHSLDFGMNNLPETICESCHYSLNVAYEFVTKVNISQVVLTNLFPDNLSHKKSIVTASNHEYKLSTAVKEELNSQDNESKNRIEEIEQNYCSNLDFEIQDLPVAYEEKFLFNSNDNASWTSVNCVCRYCTQKFANVGVLREHIKEFHQVCFGILCDECGTPFERFKEFVDHVRSHTSSLNQFCQYCNMKLENGTNHITTHTTQPNCDRCGEVFLNKTSLDHHLKIYRPKKRKRKEFALKDLSCGVEFVVPNIIQSWTEYPWVCRFCGTKVSDQESLRVHVKEVHRKCFGMKCVDCQGLEAIENFAAFIEHVREHRPNLRYYCEHCNNKSSSTDEQIVHVNENHLNPQCLTCGEYFPNHTDLQIHTAKYNPVKTRRNLKHLTTVEDLTCTICHKVAKSAKNLRAHKRVHTDRQRDFFCDRCGKSFFTKGALITHKLIHENPDPQVCKICKKAFLTLTRLKKHVKTHNEDRPFQCAECQRRFRLKEHLKGHMITHLDLLPYPCQYCNKAFKFKTILKNHERQHTGDRPYSCHVCEMDFSCWSNCDKHMKRKHGMTLAKTKLTPLGKVPINPKNCKVKKIEMDVEAKEWTEQILEPRKRGRKVESVKEEVGEVIY